VDCVTGNAGFVRNGANGNAILRWWPVIVFIVVQIIGVGVLSYRVDALTGEVRSISEGLRLHAALIGHPVMLERVTAMKETMDNTNNTVWEIRDLVLRNSVQLGRVKKERR
jgi:hypothetical protein